MNFLIIQKATIVRSRKIVDIVQMLFYYYRSFKNKNIRNKMTIKMRDQAKT